MSRSRGPPTFAARAAARDSHRNRPPNLATFRGTSALVGNSSTDQLSRSAPSNDRAKRSTPPTLVSMLGVTIETVRLRGIALLFDEPCDQGAVTSDDERSLLREAGTNV